MCYLNADGIKCWDKTLNVLGAEDHVGIALLFLISDTLLQYIHISINLMAGILFLHMVEREEEKGILEKLQERGEVR